ncbi:hypothetical protein HPB47_020979 [Ixodes persulcatus]|uniref:Uncharacterized protein n=1 Tax=Ixodes persulcatus TaxID=34615 RepID=A0AC60QDV9_IXOPE|nr:hypothetical protein HPB47_020979 [Ixodes persulcatus]
MSALLGTQVRYPGKVNPADLGPEHYVKLSPCLPQDACKDDAFKRMKLRPDLDNSRAWSILGTHVGRDDWWQRWDGLERRRLRGVATRRMLTFGTTSPAAEGLLQSATAAQMAVALAIGGGDGRRRPWFFVSLRYPGKVNPADLGPEHYVKLSPCLPQDACKDDAFKRMELRPDLDPSRAWSILGTHVGRDIVASNLSLGAIASGLRSRDGIFGA